jgi:hypothetical protein
MSKREADSPSAASKKMAVETATPLSPPRASTYWSDNPEMQSINGLFLEEGTKLQIEGLYKLLDVNGDGDLTADDFMIAMPSASREALTKWEHLRAEFDFDGSGKVDVEEFINGLKRLALQVPLDSTCFPSVPKSHRECLLWLNLSLNNAIMNLCKMLHESLVLTK